MQDFNSTGQLAAISSDTKFLWRKDVAKLLGVSERTISRYVKAGTFPPPVLPFGRPRWPQRFVHDWLEKTGEEAQAKYDARASQTLSEK